MTRRSIAWLVAVPLAVAGTQAAHALAYRIVTPDATTRAHELTTTGHAYLAYLPLVLAVGTVLLLLALVAEFRAQMAAPRRRSVGAGPWSFAVLAPAIFFCQEHFERLGHGGGVPFDAALEPTFLVGLLLQAPFAIAAYLLARLLLGAARALAGLLSESPAAARAGWSPGWNLAEASLPRIPSLALGYGSRGPPPLSR